MIDLPAPDLETVRGILARRIPEREVWAFGSRVSGKAKPYSDLDLAILGEEPLSLADLAALAEDFDESPLPFKVDLVDWATTGTAFRDVIRREAVVVREAPAR
jgi:predicted nucleotidyltransferase